MQAVEGVLKLPEAANLKGVEAKFLPRMCAHFHGSDLMVAAGARFNPLSLVAFRAGGQIDVRQYAWQGGLSSEELAMLRERSLAGEFDAQQDLLSRRPAESVRQLVSVGANLVLVRLCNGHALVEPSTLELETVPRSGVEQLYPLGPDRLLAGACGKYGNMAPVQLFWIFDAARIREPLVRVRSRETRNPSGRMVDGTPFPDEEGAIPLVEGIARLRGKKGADYSDASMHVASALVWGDKLYGFALALHRTGSSDHSFLRFDLPSRKLDRLEVLAKDDKTLNVTFARTGAGLLAFCDDAGLVVDLETLAVLDRAPLPKGLRLVGSDAERLILHHKRTSSLIVVKSGALALPLAGSLGALETEIASELAASRRSARATIGS